MGIRGFGDCGRTGSAGVVLDREATPPPKGIGHDFYGSTSWEPVAEAINTKSMPTHQKQRSAQPQADDVWWNCIENDAKLDTMDWDQLFLDLDSNMA